MPFPSVTFTFTNSTTADATQVNQDFTDIINGISDGTKNINVSAGTFAGTLIANGSVTLGASSSNLLTINASLASSIPINVTNTYDIGSDAFGLRSIYFGSGSAAHSTRLIGGSVTSAITLTLPITIGNNKDYIQSDGSGNMSWVPLRRSPDFATNYSLAASVGSSILTVTLNDATGTTPAAGSSVDINFRNSTAATGTTVVRSVTAALTINTIGAGASFGTIASQPQFIYVYALDNAGTVELALSGSRSFDEGTLQTTVGIGAGSTSAVSLYSTTSRSNVPVRFLGRLTVNLATPGTYASGPTEISTKTSYMDKQERSEIRLDTGNGFGSTNTVIRRWTTVTKNVGTAFTLTQSATNGDSITINEDGNYAYTYRDNFSSSQAGGISKNSAQLTTSINGITATNVLNMETSGGNTFFIEVTGMDFLSAGDVIRAHYQGGGAGGAGYEMFRIMKVSS